MSHVINIIKKFKNKVPTPTAYSEFVLMIMLPLSQAQQLDVPSIELHAIVKMLPSCLRPP